jgi:hypothetical protein
MARWPTGGASPDSALLVEGAGILYFDRDDADGNATGLLDLGNTDSIELTTTDTRIQKFSTRQAGRPLYRDSLQRREVTINTVLDEYSPDNVALMYQGIVSASAAQAATAVVAEPLTPALNGVTLGGVYKTAKIGPISAVTVNKGATPLILNTPTVAGDYEIQNALGMIHILPNPVTVGLVNGDDLTIDYTPTAYTGGLTQVAGGVSSKVRGKLVFVSDNSEGPNYILEVWRAIAKPNGAVGLISDNFATLPLSFSVEDDSVNHPSAPLFLKTYV